VRTSRGLVRHKPRHRAGEPLADAADEERQDGEGGGARGVRDHAGDDARDHRQHHRAEPHDVRQQEGGRHHLPQGVEVPMRQRQVLLEQGMLGGRAQEGDRGPPGARGQGGRAQGHPREGRPAASRVPQGPEERAAARAQRQVDARGVREGTCRPAARRPRPKWSCADTERCPRLRVRRWISSRSPPPS
jgi:hypothetical protein